MGSKSSGYFKCTRCSVELTIKTDPQNSVYVVESGATPNFEPWRVEDEVKAQVYMFFVYCSFHKEAENQKRERDAEEMIDAMKSLQNRKLHSKREMGILAALD